MAYVDPNYRTKRAFLDAVKAGVEHELYIAGGFYPAKQNGRATVEGPHYPEPHRWYAAVEVRDGIVIKAR